MSSNLPEGISNASKEEVQFLPNKSYNRYVCVYDKFLKWQKSQKTDSFNEEVILAYFTEIGNTLKPSTLWCIYSMLKSTIFCNHNVNIGQYDRLTTFLRNKNKGFHSTKGNMFTAKEIRKFLNEAPDDEYLGIKTVAIFMSHAMWRNDEIIRVRTDQVKDCGAEICVSTPNLKHQEPKEIRITEFTEIVRKYMELRPNTMTNRFFIQYRRGKCTVQAIGKHTIAQMAKRVAEFLALTNTTSYSGSSFRKCLVLPDTGVGIVGTGVGTTKRHPVWKPSSVAVESLGSKRKIVDTITSASNSDYENVSPEIEEFNVGNPSKKIAVECNKDMNFTKFCRACTKEMDDENKRIYLFEENSEITSIFAKCAALKIDRLDNLPAYICEHCNTKMINFHQFRLTCEKSDIYFREKLLSTSVVVKEEIFEAEELENEAALTFAEEFVKSEPCFADETPKSTTTVTVCESSNIDFREEMFNTSEEQISDFEELEYEAEKFIKSETGFGDESAKAIEIGIEECEAATAVAEELVCNVCGKTYNSKNLLEGHLREHFGIKAIDDRQISFKPKLEFNFFTQPYQCDLCNKGFGTYERICKHKRMCPQNDNAENNPKQFNCDDEQDIRFCDKQKLSCNLDGCNMTFTCTQQLQEHIKEIHLNIEKSKAATRLTYICKLCCMSFGDENTLRDHLLNRHSKGRTLPEEILG